MKTFRSSDLKQHVGEVLHAAETAPVAITKHDKLRYVLMSAEEYERQIGNAVPRRVYSIEETPEDIANLLVSELDRQLDELDSD